MISFVRQSDGKLREAGRPRVSTTCILQREPSGAISKVVSSVASIWVAKAAARLFAPLPGTRSRTIDYLLNAYQRIAISPLLCALLSYFMNK